HAPPVRRLELVEIHRVEDPRVAHDCVETTEPFERDADDRLAALAARDRLVRRDRRAASPPDLVDDPIGDAVVPALAALRPAGVVHYHRAAASCDLDRVETTESPARSGDDRDLAREIDHLRADALSEHDHAAVDDQDLAGHHVAVLGGEVHGGAGQI